MKKAGITRRTALKSGAALSLMPGWLLAQNASMHARDIPGTEESLPVIGLGTYNVFDVAGSSQEILDRKAIVDLMIEKGASVIDTSPMYNRSEKVIGDIIAAGSDRDALFLATKVWTNGRAQGEAQMQESAKLMRTQVIDLMQVHNLRDLDVHMATIREWQSEGLIRYNGITDYRASALDEMEDAVRMHKPQFIQINYSLGEREAEERLLPMARDLGVAVLINRPYYTGRLFTAVSDQKLPGWATEFCDSWGQFFLKYIVSHPAVTCAIPATSKLHHMADNLGAGFGSMPDMATRKKMASFFQDL
jgi:diketogulonate reductase-like aldo/keto reductase